MWLPNLDPRESENRCGYTTMLPCPHTHMPLQGYAAPRTAPCRTNPQTYYCGGSRDSKQAMQRSHRYAKRSRRHSGIRRACDAFEEAIPWAHWKPAMDNYGFPSGNLTSMKRFSRIGFHICLAVPITVSNACRWTSDFAEALRIPAKKHTGFLRDWLGAQPS